MSKEENQKKESRLHIRNKNRDRYDLNALIQSNPELANYVKPNKYGEDSIDFSNPMSAKILNQSLLNYYYGIKNWDFPDEYIIPPIPIRAEYIHHLADFLCENNYGTIPIGDKIVCFEIGVGANCIYPIIGVTEYDWKFIGSDIDAKSIESATEIISSNPSLEGKIECKLQENPKDFFYGIIGRDEKVDFSICNPPSHSSTIDAQKVPKKKEKYIIENDKKPLMPNLDGINKELICEGGELKFINSMIKESKKFSSNCFWFSTIVHKKTNLKGIYQTLEKFEADKIKTIPMGIGNKASQIVAWTFLTKKEQTEWKNLRWKIKK